MLLLFSSLTAAAQPPARLREQAEKQSSTKSLTVSSSAREFPTAQAMPSDVVWRRDIYRMLDLTKDENAVLYYPTTPQDGRENLFTFLFKQMLRGQITAYDYTIDGNEDFSEKNIVKARELMDRYEIFYEAKDDKVRVRDADLPSDQVKRYYIKELRPEQRHLPQSGDSPLPRTHARQRRIRRAGHALPHVLGEI